MTAPTRVLSIIGIDSMTSTGSATAVAGDRRDGTGLMTARAIRGRRLTAVLRGAAALVTLAVLVVGLPLALYRLGGDPLPRHVPAWRHVGTLLLHRDNGSVFLGAVRDLSWIAWALFTAAVAAEAQAALRGRRAPRLRLRRPAERGQLARRAGRRSPSPASQRPRWPATPAAVTVVSAVRPARRRIVPPACLRTIPPRKHGRPASPPGDEHGLLPDGHGP